MTSIDSGRSLLLVSTIAITITTALTLSGAPSAHAQMIGDTFASPLTKSRLQTTTQRAQRRAHHSSDPYMAMIEQSSPDSYLRDIAASQDPLSVASQARLASSVRTGAIAGALGVSGVAGASAMSGLPGASGIGAATLPSMAGAALSGGAFSGGVGMPGTSLGMARGAGAYGCLPSLATIGTSSGSGGACR
ncbi:hypothetical protein [Paraburkholderia tropica]|uniref:hypothetical protein n=1 Tax=Paraburkholderia tropica TaxID=92647 RepID=UPI002AB06526|nr:hypothetical protein [Paraburkholderia tropica]